MDKSLYALFENFPLSIDLSTQEQPDTTITHSSYYHHPTNELKLTQHTLNLLHDKNKSLKTIFDTRFQFYQQSIARIKTVWEEFNIPILERPILPKLLSKQDMDTVSISEIMKE